MAAEQDVDIAVETVFGNLARDSAQSFAAALLEPSQSQTESERPPKAAKVELGKRGRPSDNSHSGGRSGPGHKGQGKGGHKVQPQMTALVKAMGKLIIRQETQLQVLKQNSAWQVYLQPDRSRSYSRRRRPTRSRRKPSLWRHRSGLSCCAPSFRHCCTAFKPSAPMSLNRTWCRARDG